MIASDLNVLESYSLKWPINAETDRISATNSVTRFLLKSPSMKCLTLSKPGVIVRFSQMNLFLKDFSRMSRNLDRLECCSRPFKRLAALLLNFWLFSTAHELSDVNSISVCRFQLSHKYMT